EVHDLADLLGVRLGERTAEDGEVLGEDVDRPAVDPSIASDDAVTGIDLVGEAEVGSPVGDEPVELDEAPLVEQQIETLARGELALLVLLGDPCRSAALLGERLAVMEILKDGAGIGHDGQEYNRPRHGELRTTETQRHRDNIWWERSDDPLRGVMMVALVLNAAIVVLSPGRPYDRGDRTTTTPQPGHPRHHRRRHRGAPMSGSRAPRIGLPRVRLP